MNNKALCYSAPWYLEETKLLRGNTTRKVKVLEGCSQFDATVIYINTHISPYSAKENQRFIKMRAPVPHSKAWRVSTDDSLMLM